MAIIKTMKGAKSNSKYINKKYNKKKKESGAWGGVIDLTHLSKTVERQTASITEEVLSNERREDTPPVKTL